MRIEYPNTFQKIKLVYTLERRHSLALILIQSSINNATVLDFDIGFVDVALESESMFHPFVVITVGEVLTGMGATGFLAGSGGSDCLNSALQNISELKCLHEIADLNL